MTAKGGGLRTVTLILQYVANYDDDAGTSSVALIVSLADVNCDGAVTGKEISEAVGAQLGVEITKQQVVSDPIKTFGTHEVRAKLGYEVSAPFYVEVIEDK